MQTLPVELVSPIAALADPAATATASWYDAIGGAFRDAVTAAIQRYGPGTVLLFGFCALLLWMLHRSWEARLKDKDAEIARIAAERDYLQGIVLNKQLSTKSAKTEKTK